MSLEFGWKSSNIMIDNSSIMGEYLFLDSNKITINEIKLNGKYSFQYVQELEINETKITEENLAELIKLIDTSVISSAIAKKVFIEMFETGKMAKQIVEEKGLIQITDTKAIEEIIIKVVENNAQSVNDYIASKDKAMGFLVGQIMKETKGKANPKIVNEILLKILEAKKNA